MGKFAKIARMRFASGDRNAKLWEISWMARNRFWLEVAPITYAVARNRQSRIGVLRRRYAQVSCRETTPRTTHFVRDSGPQSFVTWSESQVLTKPGYR
jgi:hypothetical protein